MAMEAFSSKLVLVMLVLVSVILVSITEMLTVAVDEEK